MEEREVKGGEIDREAEKYGVDGLDRV
jgi:hypothetical protein